MQNPAFTDIQQAGFFSIFETMSQPFISLQNVSKHYSEDSSAGVSSIDLNIKAYKELDFGQVWAGLSYRRSFDGAEYSTTSGVSKQNLQYITPIVGVNFDKFMFAYTYSKVSGDVKFDTGGYHQITLGINLFCRPEKYDCNCPAIN